MSLQESPEGQKAFYAFRESGRNLNFLPQKGTGTREAELPCFVTCPSVTKRNKEAANTRFDL
jgi:hypothetical protein